MGSFNFRVFFVIFLEYLVENWAIDYFPNPECALALTFALGLTKPEAVSHALA